MNTPGSINPKQKELLENLYKRYAQRLAAYGMRVYKTGEDQAWDLAYKTLFRVTEKYDSYLFENEKKQSAFVFRVYINYLKNHFRDNKHRPAEVELDEIEVKVFTKENTASPKSTELKILEDELEKLEEWQRMLLLLRSQEMSYQEIAKYIDKTEDQLKVYYQRLKKKISERIASVLAENKNKNG